MSFCNACGANIDRGAGFCAKCGAAQMASGMTPAAGSAPAVPPRQGSNGTKIILIIVAVVVGLGLLGMCSAAFVAWRFARHTRIDNRNGNVRVESPFGTVVSTTDPDDTARNLGVDLYPGARMLKGQSANIDVGGIHSTTAQFESDDPADKVADFYKAKFPDAAVTSQNSGHYAIIARDDKNLITISIQTAGGKTQVNIAKVSGKGVTGGSSN